MILFECNPEGVFAHNAIAIDGRYAYRKRKGKTLLISTTCVQVLGAYKEQAIIMIKKNGAEPIFAYTHQGFAHYKKLFKEFDVDNLYPRLMMTYLKQSLQGLKDKQNVSQN